MLVSGYATRPDYRVDLLTRRNRVQVRKGDVLIADTCAAMIVDEQDHAIVFYVPPADIDWSTLVPVAGKTSFCPYKGEAVYFAAASDPATPIAWRYDAPFREVGAIAGYLGFYQERVALIVGGDG